MGEVTITAEMVMEVTAIKRSAAEGIAVYATHRFAGLLPADARRETNVSMGTGGRNEKVIRLLCDRYDLRHRLSRSTSTLRTSSGRAAALRTASTSSEAWSTPTVRSAGQEQRHDRCAPRAAVAVHSVLAAHLRPLRPHHRAAVAQAARRDPRRRDAKCERRRCGGHLDRIASGAAS